MKYLIRILLMIIWAGLILACSDEFKHPLVKDSIPIIPVTFEGAKTFGFNPFYTVSYSNNSFAITLTIPENSPVRIREISNIVAGPTSINVASLSNPQQYLDAPVLVNGTSFTLTTSIEEFNAKAISSPVASAPAPGAIVERAFMFRLIMEDNSIIVPVQCRILVVP